jgi:VWFA-related protein
MSWVAVALLAFAAALHGQQQSGDAARPGSEPSATGADVPTLHAGTHLVVLDVVVTDKKGHTVPGLTQDAFHIFEDGRPQAAKFFEEHAPLDPASVARQKADLAARLPVNTFTDYEPFTGNPPMVLLLNEVGSLPPHDYDPLYRRMLALVHDAPPETPFVVYELDSQLRLVLPLTTNRELVKKTVDGLWQAAHFSPDDNASDDAIVARREVFSAAMKQFGASFETTPGRKTVFAFTGGLQCALGRFKQDCVVPLTGRSGTELETYLCGVMDVLEQGRVSLYRYYPSGQVVYGFGCDGEKTTLQDVLETNSHYYTFYYSPTNGDWNGVYRRLQVELADKHLHASYRTGYYGRPENTTAGHFAAATDVPGLLGSAARDVKATATADGFAGDSVSGEKPGLGSTIAPNPAPVIFSVQAIPAAAPGAGVQATPPAPGNDGSEADRLQGYRDYTLHVTVPAAGVRIARELKPGQAQTYAARLQIAAVSYTDGSPADAKASQVTASFTGPTDPQIAKGEITASLTLQVPEKGKRLLHVTVRDVYSGQVGMLDIPVEKVVLPVR